MENQKLLLLSIDLLQQLSTKVGINNSIAIIEPDKLNEIKEENRIIALKILNIKQDILSIFDKLNQNEQCQN